MQLTTDFETGSGVPLRLGEARWRLETVGDPFGYNRYFCVRVENDSPQRRTLDLSIHPDPQLPNSHFMTHFPSHLWCGRGDGSRWAPLRQTNDDSCVCHTDHLAVRMALQPREIVWLASNVPYAYSALQRWIDQAAQRPGVALGSLGVSQEGRMLPVLKLCRPGRPRLLVLAGMHSSEHSGVWASQGIVDWLTSGIVEARRTAQAFDIAVVPMLNPDGNVHGYSGGNAQRLMVNNSLDFLDAASGVPPQTHENRLLWGWLSQSFTPDYLLHFHAYLGWRRGGDHPCDGLYLLPEPNRLLSAVRQRQLRLLVDRLKFDTPAFSAHWDATGTLGPATLEHQLATGFDVLSVLYEINAGSVGPSEQYRRGPQVLGAFGRALLDDATG